MPTPTNILTNIFAHACTHTLTYAFTYTHTLTCTLYTHTNKHTLTHAYTLSNVLDRFACKFKIIDVCTKTKKMYYLIESSDQFDTFNCNVWIYACLIAVYLWSY